MAGAAALVGVAPQPSIAQNAPAIHVLKDLNCGCCEAWVRVLQAEGFEVTTETSFGTLLIRHKRDNRLGEPRRNRQGMVPSQRGVDEQPEARSKTCHISQPCDAAAASLRTFPIGGSADWKRTHADPDFEVVARQTSPVF